MLSLGSVTDKSLYCVKNKLREVEFSPFWFKMRTWPSSLRSRLLVATVNIAGFQGAADGR